MKPWVRGFTEPGTYFANKYPIFPIRVELALHTRRGRRSVGVTGPREDGFASQSQLEAS